MATAYKILGQAAPAATTATDLYTVPASTSTIISSLTISNRSTTAAATFRLSTSAAGAATADKDYIAYDITIAPSGIVILTVGLTLATTDKVRVYASTANLSFNAYGTEIS
jgi:hypothetical protein